MVRYGVGEALWYSIGESWSVTVMSLRALGQIITGDRAVSEIKGPLGIGHISGVVAKLGGFR